MTWYADEMSTLVSKVSTHENGTDHDVSLPRPPE
jgi:hypothetical protein